MDQVRRVPYLDLTSQIEPIRSDINSAIQEAIDASDFVLGPRVKAFEAAFAGYCDTRHAIGVSSGTEALFLILRALGVGPGDEVITVPNAFIAAVECIRRVGARPVLVDVQEDTFCIDPDAVERCITERTRAIIPVHLFGLPADMDELSDIAARHDIRLIEDACQAHGALYKGRKVGSIGDAAAFSFYPTKNLGGMGDGGAVTTNDDGLAETIRQLRHHGQPERNVHTALGYNARLDSLQAAVLSVKLPYLDRWNAVRRDVAARYRSALKDSDYVFQSVPGDRTSVYHVMAVRHPRRDLVHDQLHQRGIGFGEHIARPINLQSGYRELGYGPGEFQVSEILCEQLVSLPISHTLSDGDVDYVADVLSKVVVRV